jgi:hypothetical protein
MEEVFFFQYHMHLNKTSCMQLQISERRFLIERFSQQKEKEQQEYEKEARKAKTRR